jgi:hypothetical protein
MLLYADEDFPFPVVEQLRQLGHDVLTAQEDGRTGGRRLPIPLSWSGHMVWAEPY